MNISPKIKNSVINFNIKKETREQFFEYAKKNGVTVTDLLTNFIELTLKKAQKN